MVQFVAVDNKYSALIPKKEIHSAIYAGDHVEGRVASVREDGKLKPHHAEADKDADQGECRDDIEYHRFI